MITALTSNQMIAPSIWIDPRNGNHYYLAVQYPEKQVQNMVDLRSIPLRGPASTQPTRLDMVSSIQRDRSANGSRSLSDPRAIDIYVRPPARTWAASPTQIDRSDRRHQDSQGRRRSLCGEWCRACARPSRALRIGLLLSVLLLYLILVAQFRSFIDPFIILLAFPPAITGVLLTLWLTGTTLNVCR